MRKLANRLPSHATVAAYAALFTALATGGAYAADNLIRSNDIARDAVKSKQIANGKVKSADIADNAVSSPKVADGSLRSEDFAAGQLPAGQQGPQGLRGPAGATNVTVRSALIAGLAQSTITCQPGERATGGGVYASGADDAVTVSRPEPDSGTPTGWVGGVQDLHGGTTGGGQVYVVCAAP